MNSQLVEPSTSTIQLPKDPVRQSQLRRKLDEYRFRLKMPLYEYAETAYKISVLERLLRDGSVNAVALAVELAADPARHLDHAAFYNAFAVIESYCKDGGAAAIGGTGLPEVR